MMLNPGQVSPNQGAWGGNLGSLIGGGVGQALPAYGNNLHGIGAQGFGGQGFGAQGFNAAGQMGSPIDDIADDIAERISNEITDQAATAASALYQSQLQQQSPQPISGLNVKRWLNASRTTDAVQESVKQSVHQLCRQVVVQLLGQLQAQSGGFGQLGGFGQMGQAGLAAYGTGAPYGQAFHQPNVAQLAPVVASILNTLQAQAQGSSFGGRLI